MSSLVRAVVCVLGFALVACGGGGNGQSGDAASHTPDGTAIDSAQAIDGTHAGTLVAIQLTPATAAVALGNTQAYAALGIFSDGAHRDVTTEVTWSVAPATAATVSASGLATTLAIGTATVTAADTATGVQGTAQLKVGGAVLTAQALSPASATVASGAAQQYTATGTFSDATTEDMTANVTWSVTAGSATVTNPPQLAGHATSHGLGTSTIAATDPVSGLGATATLIATDATLVAIAVAPAAPTFTVGQTQLFTATGTFSDATTADLTGTVTWSSSTAHASISNAAATKGLATGVTAGPATLKALDPASAVFGTAAATVIDGAPALSAFTPAGQFTSVGHTRAATFPLPLTVAIAVARTVDTPVTVTSTASIALNGTAGAPTTVTIPAGQLSAVVLVTGVTKDPAATLTATTGTGGTLSRTVRVLDYAQETPKLALAPATATMAGGDTKAFSAGFDIPVHVATLVPLSYTSAAALVSPPASVTVAADQQTVAFTLTAAATATGTTVITSGAATSTITYSGATACTPSQIVISQVYGGGGNSGATLKNDFIELFNRGTTDVNLGGFSVWIASATGTFTQQTVIPAGSTIAAHGYFLIGEAAGTGGTLALPTPDVVGTLGLSATGGKVVLAGPGSITPGQSCPMTNVIDLVGAAGANCFEGAVGPAGTAVKSLLRGDGGCTDTTDNSSDFTAATAAPRNSGAAAHSCPVSCGE